MNKLELIENIDRIRRVAEMLPDDAHIIDADIYPHDDGDIWEVESFAQIFMNEGFDAFVGLHGLACDRFDKLDRYKDSVSVDGVEVFRLADKEVWK